MCVCVVYVYKYISFLPSFSLFLSVLPSLVSPSLHPCLPSFQVEILGDDSDDDGGDGDDESDDESSDDEVVPLYMHIYVCVCVSMCGAYVYVYVYIPLFFSFLPSALFLLRH